MTESPLLKGDGLVLQFHWQLTQTEDDYEKRETCWISTRDGEFPCRGWKDSPLGILMFFTSQTYDMVRESYIKKRYVPFDPYYILLDRSQQGIITIHFLRSYLPKPLEKLPPITLPLVDFCNILLETGHTLLETYRSGGYGDPMSLQSLEHWMTLLSSAMSEDQM